MRATVIKCDSCHEDVGRDGTTLEYGRTGCVTARADLCDGCRKKMEKGLGIDWTKLRESNKSEDPC